MEGPLDELGKLIDARWRAANYDEGRLPDLAGEALTESRLPGRVDPFEVLREFHGASPVPEQRDVEGRFSDLPLTLYNGTRFYIDLYFWLDGTTEIHQHAFAGAFQVLSGASLHSRYAFAREREINPRFLLGRLGLERVELLRQGEVRRIVPGPEMIHSLFHLDRPSVTLTVRSHQSPSAAPQFSYLRPSIAVDPFFREPGLAKKVQTVSLLLKMRHPDADALIGQLLAESDFEGAFRMLEVAGHLLLDNKLDQAFGLSMGIDRLNGLMEIARVRHGDLMDVVPPVFAERQRQTQIIRRRGSITSEPHRFFLALLLNVGERSRVIELVAERYRDDDPIETIVDWVQELGATRELGASENVLGIDGWDDDHVFACECLFRGLTDVEIEAEVARQFPAAPAARLSALMPGILTRLRTAVLFRATLNPSAGNTPAGA